MKTNKNMLSLICPILVCMACMPVTQQLLQNYPQQQLVTVPRQHIFHVPKKLNFRPIVGVLTQDLHGKLQKLLPQYDSYISASYVKYLESAGVRVAPILVNQSNSYYERMFKGINGLLFPGGSQYFQSSGYGHAGKILWDLAIKSNKAGDYFPVWGTCLGFEMMMYLAADGKDWRTSCNAFNEVAPLHLTENIWRSRLLGNAPYQMIEYLEGSNVSVNFHKWCYTKKNFQKSGLDRMFLLLSTNHDEEGKEFISTVEAYDLPFYGTQWHPEKNGFEWTLKEPNIPHSTQAVQVMQFFANYFSEEARKNFHHFSSLKEEQAALIYNYQPVYTDVLGYSFVQVYGFNSKGPR